MTLTDSFTAIAGLSDSLFIVGSMLLLVLLPTARQLGRGRRGQKRHRRRNRPARISN